VTERGGYVELFVRMAAVDGDLTIADVEERVRRVLDDEFGFDYRSDLDVEVETFTPTEARPARLALWERDPHEANRLESERNEAINQATVAAARQAAAAEAVRAVQDAHVDRLER